MERMDFITYMKELVKVAPTIGVTVHTPNDRYTYSHVRAKKLLEEILHFMPRDSVRNRVKPAKFYDVVDVEVGKGINNDCAKLTLYLCDKPPTPPQQEQGDIISCGGLMKRLAGSKYDYFRVKPTGNGCCEVRGVK